MQQTSPESIFPEQQTRREEHRIGEFFVNFKAQPFDFSDVVDLAARARLGKQSVGTRQRHVFVGLLRNLLSQFDKFIRAFESSRIDRTDRKENVLFEARAEQTLCVQHNVYALSAVILHKDHRCGIGRLQRLMLHRGVA